MSGKYDVSYATLYRDELLLIEGQKLTGSTTNFREGQLDTPDFSLVSKTVFTNSL